MESQDEVRPAVAQNVEFGGEAAAAAGWPLGLPPVTLQMQQLARAFSTALHPAPYSSAFLLATPTSCSSLESSDPDTESSLFSFQARSTTLGSLMGIRLMTEPNLIRAPSLAVATSSRSQVSTLRCNHPQSCHMLELACQKLVIRRQQFKCIATDSAKFCNNFLIRCTACVQAQLCHKQSRSRSSSICRAQPVNHDVAKASSLAHLLQMERESCSPVQCHQRRTLFIDIMYEGASSLDHCSVGKVHNLQQVLAEAADMNVLH